MSKLRKILMSLLAVGAVACAGAGLTACAKNFYPDFINHSGGSGPSGEESAESGYTVTVQSLGGLSLNGVRVAAKLDGQTVVEGISVNGKIHFDLDPAEYDLVVNPSTLPEGYYVPENASFTTSATENAATVSLPSKVIATTATPGTTYSLGQVMYDFSFTDTEGERRTLSQILEEKKAAVINIWYIDCNPCKSEFPKIQEAYSSFTDDIAVVALSPYDSIGNIAKFREEYGLTFSMGQDQVGLTRMFGVSAFPTSVIIDRYGVIAYVHTGSIVDARVWSAMFSNYVSDDYVQQNPNDDKGEESEQELVREKPTVEMPASAAIANAVNGSGTDKKVGEYRPETKLPDAEYSWPWIVESDPTYGDYIAASNKGIGYSYAILYTDITLNSGDILSYDYKIKSEAGCDMFYVLVDGNIIKEYSDDSEGWQTEATAYIATRNTTIEFALVYIKDEMFDEENECACFGNLSIVNASEVSKATDIETPAASGAVVGGKYQTYAKIALCPDDGYYHILNEDGTFGAILLADILNPTAWSDLHFEGDGVADADGLSWEPSMYMISYWQMSNWDELSDGDGVQLAFDFGYTDTLIANYYWQGFSDNGYVPVSESVKQMLVAFAQTFCTRNNAAYYEEQWLEFCYYFVHYGGPHPDGEACYLDLDPIKGIDPSNSYIVYENQTTRVNVTRALKYNRGGGLFYKFVPQKSGVYYFFTESDNSVDPYVLVVDGADNVIAYYDDDLRVTNFLNPNRFNVYGYVYLERGETYYFQCRFNVPGSVGAYDFTVSYQGESFDLLRVCTTADGLWTYNDKITYYLAVEVALGPDGCYYHVLDDGSLGSKIYIDFVHPNYYDNNNHTLLEIVQAGYFDFGEYSDDGFDFTQVMLSFYYASIDGKSEGDELYGMAEATEELVNIICAFLEIKDGESRVTNFWLSLAAYYQHFGA